jgi:hypothetical protein
MAVWYVRDDGVYGWTSIVYWQAGIARTVGQIRRQTSGSLGNNSRAFIRVVAGTTGASEPTWNLSPGALTDDGAVSGAWKECTGQAAVNGNIAQAPAWQALATVSLTTTLITKNAAATHYFTPISITTGITDSVEPTWDTVTGHQTVDAGVTWLCLGAVGSFPAWGAPAKTLLSIVDSTTYSFVQAGDKVYTSETHYEGWNAATVNTSNGTLSNPIYILCIRDNSAASPVLSTGARIVNTSEYGNSIFGINCYIYGVHFTLNGSGATAPKIGSSSPSSILMYMDNCYIQWYGTLTVGGTLNRIVIKDCTFNLEQTNCLVSLLQSVEFDNLSFLGSQPASGYLFRTNSSGLQKVSFANTDFRFFGTTPIFQGSNCQTLDAQFRNCRFEDGYSVATSGIPSTAPGFTMVNCGVYAAAKRFTHIDFGGTITDDTAMVLNGTAFSIKAVTSSDASFISPLEIGRVMGYRYNSIIGSTLTATIEINSSLELTDGDIWFTLEYQGNVSSPKGDTATNKRGILSSAVAHASSSAVWPSGTAQKMQVTFTPQQAGPVAVRVYVAKASATIYINPEIALMAA